MGLNPALCPGDHNRTMLRIIYTTLNLKYQCPTFPLKSKLSYPAAELTTLIGSLVASHSFIFTLWLKSNPVIVSVAYLITAMARVTNTWRVCIKKYYCADTCIRSIAVQCWRDGSVFNSIDCSCTGPVFGS